MVQQRGRIAFLAGDAALITDGSWQIGTYVNDAPFDVGFVPLPVGPQGRKSMLNSVADSIWAGTPHPEAAWAWVTYLGSVDCQLIVGEYAVTFPALQLQGQTKTGVGDEGEGVRGVDRQG